MKSLEALQREQIDRLHAMLAVERVQTNAMRDALAAREIDLREWQDLAVELGAFAQVERNKAMMTLDCSLKIAAPLLAQAKDRRSLIAHVVHDQIARPMVAECERIWGSPAEDHQ